MAVALAAMVQTLLGATFLVLCPLVQAHSTSRESAFGGSGSVSLGAVAVVANEIVSRRDAPASPDGMIGDGGGPTGAVDTRIGSRLALGAAWVYRDSEQAYFGEIGPPQFVRALQLRFGTLHRLAEKGTVLAGAGLALSGLILLQIGSLAIRLWAAAREGAFAWR